MSKTTTQHVTEVGAVQFMAAARPLANKHKGGKMEYVLKLLLKDGSETYNHILDVSAAKITSPYKNPTPVEGYTEIKFTSDYAVKVVSVDGQELEADEIPFFDSTKDKATAAASYSVIDYGNGPIVRLTGIRLMSLEQAPREEGGAAEDINVMDKLKSI